MINRPFDPECKRCGGTGYVDYYTAHLDYELAERCDCDAIESKYFTGDTWLPNATVIPARFYGPLLVSDNVRRIVLHCGNSDGDNFGSYFQNPITRDSNWQERWRVVSAHFAVLNSGELQQFVPLNRVAWHAHGANSDSIGIEMQGPHTRNDWSRVVVNGVAELIRAVCMYYPIEQVCSHKSLAPLRRNDPGKNFPWVALGEQLLGLVITP